MKFLLFADCARPETAKAIAHFMIRQELIGDVDRGGNDYRQHPAIWPWRELLAKCAAMRYLLVVTSPQVSRHRQTKAAGMQKRMCPCPFIGHLLDTEKVEFSKYLVLLARPRGFEPLLPP